jgi:hypothetical protein
VKRTYVLEMTATLKSWFTGTPFVPPVRWMRRPRPRRPAGKGVTPTSLIEAVHGSYGLGASSQRGLALVKRAENPVLGTWKLKAMFREVTATGEKFNQMGEHPNGYLNYSADGRMYAIATADNRTKPSDVNLTPDERAKLHQTLVAYAGTFTVEGDKVIHRVDISWNEAWTGTEQIRFAKIDGNTLTVTTAVQKSPIDGREGRSVLVWEKVKGPTQ